MPPFTTATGARWQRSLAEAIRDPEELLRLLDLDGTSSGVSRDSEFPLLVPRSYVARMRQGDAADPLLRQVLPLTEERHVVPGFTTDAVGDVDAKRVPGVLQKYSSRVLLIATGACAVHCRYCFRRHYPYGEEPRRLDDWEPALRQIAGDPSIREVIFSGGDPLMLTDQRLGQLIERCERIEHIRWLRLHTRLPIVLPERVCSSFLEILDRTRLKPLVAIHANHANELVADCAEAITRLREAGVSLLNQTVLLRGVNDSVDALEALSVRLVDLGVQPYYLHQLDRVAGAAHFEVPEEQGRTLLEELRRRLPGHALPRYVREEAGLPFKWPL